MTPALRCAAADCAHNGHGRCGAAHITVARMPKKTAGCTDYVYRERGSDFSSEFSAPIGYVNPGAVGIGTGFGRLNADRLRAGVEDPEVRCLATDCLYNRKDHCHAAQLKVKSPAENVLAEAICGLYRAKG